MPADRTLFWEGQSVIYWSLSWPGCGVFVAKIKGMHPMSRREMMEDYRSTFWKVLITLNMMEAEVLWDV